MPENAIQPPTETAPLTCDFMILRDNVSAGDKCQRTDYALVEMHDGGIVRLCPKHRSWAATLGRPKL